MNKHVEVLLEKSKERSRKISRYPIKSQLSWKILKGGIWCSLAYTLPPTMISLNQGYRIDQALYWEAIKSLGKTTTSH